LLWLMIYKKDSDKKEDYEKRIKELILK